jgi:hypothetical protein
VDGACGTNGRVSERKTIFEKFWNTGHFKNNFNTGLLDKIFWGTAI